MEILPYQGGDHGCSTNYNQCYWTDLETAKQQCTAWDECKYLYQSDRWKPATSGNPVYWARRAGDSGPSPGDFLWKQKEGNHIFSVDFLLVKYNSFYRIIKT